MATGIVLSKEEADNLVEWLSEIGILSYDVAPDPNPIGVGMRERVISSKHVLGADPPGQAPPAPKLQYDAVNWQAVPADAAHVAGYIDGPQSQWPAEAWAKFPNAKRITVLGALQGADICDCEVGDLTPQQASAWYAQTGGIVYIERSRLGELSGVPLDHIWVADWTGQPHLYPGSWGTQYANPTTSGGDYDLSVLA